jgi:hypothetical protein
MLREYEQINELPSKLSFSQEILDKYHKKDTDELDETDSSSQQLLAQKNVSI